MWNFYPWGRGGGSPLQNLMNARIGPGWRTGAHDASSRGCGCSCLLVLLYLVLFGLLVAVIAVACVLDELGLA